LLNKRDVLIKQETKLSVGQLNVLRTASQQTQTIYLK